MILAIVGMPGSGKSLLSDYLHSRGFPLVRFGNIILKEVERRGLPLTAQTEEEIREALRQEHGMDVCAKLALPLIRTSLARHHTVVIDGLYSFSEYKTLRNEFGEDLVVVAVIAPRMLRYERLASRSYRPLTTSEAMRRDYHEIEQIEKSGPIAIADFTLLNDGTPDEFIRKAIALLSSLSVRVS